MWFKELFFNPELLRPIPEIRPILNMYGKKIEQTEAIANNDLGIPHYVYDIRLNDISEGKGIPEEPSALRILDMKDDAPIAFYDLGLNEKNPELIQMNTNHRYFELLDRTMGKLKRVDSENKDVGELRSIRIPALNLEAMWLKYQGKTKDLISVLPRFDYHHIKTDILYSPEEFIKLAREEVKEMGNLDDDTIGS